MQAKLNLIALGLLLTTAMLGCSQSAPPLTPPAAAPKPATLVLVMPTLAATDSQAPEKDYEELFTDFNRSMVIDNQWFPLKPGTRYVYDGFTDKNGERVTRRVVITVTDLIKVINGVRTVVTFDLDYNADELVEAELAFFAQDDNGTVWRMGEYPEEYEKGMLVDVPTWIHGIEEARAGIMMEAEPRMGTRSYAQGWGPAVGFADRARLVMEGQRDCVAFGCYDDVSVYEEYSIAEPDASQLKSYARGIGNIRVAWKGEDKTRETLELVDHSTLDASAMAQMRAEVLKLEKHAYEISKEVYGRTSPLQLPLETGRKP